MNAQLAPQPARQGGKEGNSAWRESTRHCTAVPALRSLLAALRPRTCVLQQAGHVAAVARRLSQLSGQGGKAVVSIHNNQGVCHLSVLCCGLGRTAAAAAASRSSRPQGLHKARDAGQQRLLREKGCGGGVDDIKGLPCRSSACHGSADAVRKAVHRLGWHRLHGCQAGLCIASGRAGEGELALDGMQCCWAMHIMQGVDVGMECTPSSSQLMMPRSPTSLLSCRVTL